MSERMSRDRLAALHDDWAIYGTLDGGLGDELYEALIAERAEVERLRNELAKHQDGGVWKESNQSNLDNIIADRNRWKATAEALLSFRESVESTVEEFKRVTELALPIANHELSLAAGYERAIETLEAERDALKAEVERLTRMEHNASVVAETEHRLRVAAEKVCEAAKALNDSMHEQHDDRDSFFEALDAALAEWEAQR